MTRTTHNNRLIALVASTALASVALSGCTTKAAPRADLSADKAQSLLAKGKTDKAIGHAEAAVLADPRNAAYRAMLGAAYLEEGRFVSAAQSFDDAMALGDQSARTALSYALAEIAAGNHSRAIAVLDDWRDDIPAADLGLAFALAGEADRGVHILGNALRAGENTPKLRQNLAYAYALQGNWRAARLMAAEDVPAGQLEDRISEWARTARPDDYGKRVAALLGVDPVADPGQPVALALANHPSAEQLVAEAAALVPARTQPQTVDIAPSAPSAELPPLELPAAPAPSRAQPLPQLAQTGPDVARPEKFEDAFAAPAPTGATLAQMVENTVRFISQPVVQKMPARHGAAEQPARREARRPERVSGDHLVQLGSFSSRQGARRAWGIYTKRHPELENYDMVITEARVRGKTYWRVSAGGLGASQANSMCASVKRGGEGCITWAANSPLPGAVDSGVRMASR